MRGLRDPHHPGTATLDPHGAGHLIDARAFHQRQIDDESVVARAQAAPVVSPTADGDREPALASEIDGADDVRRIRAASD
jgi:hypothetical protein